MSGPVPAAAIPSHAAVPTGGDCYEEVKGVWEERFESLYGFWHGLLDETVCELIAQAAGSEVRPGMVATVHTAASDLRWHPRVHALASRGGWDRAG